MTTCTAEIINQVIGKLDNIPVSIGLKIWKNTIESIQHTIQYKKSIQLAQLGIFVMNSSKDIHFYVHPDLIQATNMYVQPEVFKAEKFNIDSIVSMMDISKNIVEKFYNEMFHVLVQLILQSKEYPIRLGFLPMGEWIIENKKSFFQVHQKISIAKSNASSVESKSRKAPTIRARTACDTKSIGGKSVRSQRSVPCTARSSKQLSIPKVNGNNQRQESTQRGSKSQKPETTSQSNQCIEVLERVKSALLARGGSHGIHGISRMMRIMDNSGDKRLSRDEFRYGLRDFGVDCNENELDHIFQFYDKNGDGYISFDEFLVSLRGDISPRRLLFIEMAYRKLDRTNDGQVTIDDLRDIYDVTMHPEYIQGKKSKDQLLGEFLSQWDTDIQDGIVTFDEFIQYYRNVSASIDDDNYFELMMRNAWHLSGGTGQCANSSIKRILVTHTDGHQSIEEISSNQNQINQKKEPIEMLHLLLYSPPCSVDILAKKLGANRILGNGQEIIHLKAFATALTQYDKRISFKEAFSIAKSFDSNGSQLIHIPTLHKELSHRFGHENSSQNSVLDRLKAKIIARGGISGLHSIQRMMRIWDDSGDGKLTKIELKKGLEDFGIDINLQEVDHLMTLFDTDKSGTISFDELVVGLRGSINQRRMELIHQAYAKLDVTKDGQVTIDDLRLLYNVKQHPKVVSKIWSEKQALMEFLKQWDTEINDGIITLNEFITYYKNVSASIDGDDYFELMIQNAWQLKSNKIIQINKEIQEKPEKNKIKSNNSIESLTILTRREREIKLEKIKIKREEAAIQLQSKFREFKSRKFVDCVRRKQKLKNQINEINEKPKILRPALRSYHGF